MKKIATIALLFGIFIANLHAQKTIAEQEVPSRMVTDFQRQQVDARNVTWSQYDSITYQVDFNTPSDNATQGLRYISTGGGSLRALSVYSVDLKYTPRAIADTIARRYPGFHLTHLRVLASKRESFYEARVAKKSGFLFWRKESEVHFLTFETNGQFKEER